MLRDKLLKTNRLYDVDGCLFLIVMPLAFGLGGVYFVFKGLVLLMGTFWEKCISYLNSVWNYINRELTTAWDWMLSSCESVWNEVCGIGMKGLEWCGSFWNTLW